VEAVAEARRLTTESDIACIASIHGIPMNYRYVFDSFCLFEATFSLCFVFERDTKHKPSFCLQRKAAAFVSSWASLPTATSKEKHQVCRCAADGKVLNMHPEHPSQLITMLESERISLESWRSTAIL
jgi:hypothetical protein